MTKKNSKVERIEMTYTGKGGTAATHATADKLQDVIKGRLDWLDLVNVRVSEGDVTVTFNCPDGLVPDGLGYVDLVASDLDLERIWRN